MNYGRLVAAAAVGTVVDFVYGFFVYGQLLHSQFARFPMVYRPADAAPQFLMLMSVGIFIGLLAAVVIYHQGYSGATSGAAEGARFGMLMGVFVAIYFSSVDYGILNIGRQLAACMVVAGIVEWTLVGTAIGAIYRPAVKRVVRV